MRSVEWLFVLVLIWNVGFGEYESRLDCCFDRLLPQLSASALSFASPLLSSLSLTTQSPSLPLPALK